MAEKPDTPAGAGAAATPQVRRMLFASDLSEVSDRAFAHARFLSQWLGAKLVLYHAVETPPHHPEGLWERADELRAGAEQAAREHLRGLATQAEAPAEVVVEATHSAHRAVVRFAEKAAVDLAVMGTHGREGLAHLLLGSVTEKLVQHGSCSVLCVREPEHGVHIPYRRVLVPTDLSPAAERAFPLMALLARRFEVDVVPIHVVRPGAADVPDEGRIRKSLEGSFADLRILPRIASGTPWRTIVDVAGAESIDLIAMSTLGHDSLADTVLGSTTERVVRHAPCPVLVARPPRAPASA